MRRVITTNNEAGRSQIQLVEAVSSYQCLWQTVPELSLGFDPGQGQPSLEISAGATKFVFFELPPDEIMQEYFRLGIPLHDEEGFHRTGTIDYVIVLDGPLTLVLDEGEIELQFGDCVVQRDTRHAWRNRTGRPIRMLSVLVGLSRK